MLKNKSKTHEKSRVRLIIFLILGLIFIGIGYYLAIKPNTAIGSLGIIFFAILSTLIGTYLLFVSLGSIVLEMLQKLDYYYYKLIIVFMTMLLFIFLNANHFVMNHRNLP